MKERYDELIKLIEKANVEYYTLDNPSVTDREYDNWMSELLDIEEKYPELNSIMLVIAAQPAWRLLQHGSDCAFLWSTSGR